MQTIPRSAERMGVVVTTEELASRAWGPFHGFAGVSYKPLWDGTADRWGPGLVRIEQGASIPRHTHRHSVHHIWILEGRCWMRGRALEAGSYAYVPAGVEHAVHEAGADGCTMLYLYLPADEAGERS